jgi:uncharacterized protein YsxB (DUF464 family)
LINIYYENLLFDEGVSYKDNYIFSIKVEVPSTLSEKGKDIICASVSILTHTLAVSIKKLIIDKFFLKNEDGFFHLKIEMDSISEKEKKDMLVLLNFFTIGIFEIKNEYNNRIKIFFN